MALPDVVQGQSGHVGHHNTIHNWTQTDELHRYVSLGGNDSNDGRTPLEPKLTIQAAYDSLPSAGGAVMIGGGRHDVGAAGIQLTRTKPVGLYGRSWRRVNPGSSTFPTGAGTVLFTSSGSPPPQLVSFPNPVGALNCRGFYATDLTFEVKSGMDYAILGMAVNDGTVEHCNFHLSDASAAYAIGLSYDGDTGDDASWWRVQNNYVIGGGLFKTMNLQHNQHVISDNACLEGTVPYVHLLTNNRTVVRDNNFEANTTGPFMIIENSWACQTSGNAGECQVAGNVFCRVDASYGCLLQDIGTSSPSSTDTLYEFVGSANNLAIISTFTFSADLYTTATRITDDGANKQNYYMTGGDVLDKSVWLPYLKRGTGTPESVVWGYPGDQFLRTDGGASTTLYVKTSGAGTNTGWTAK